jgi:hypothetical protein
VIILRPRAVLTDAKLQSDAGRVQEF